MPVPVPVGADGGGWVWGVVGGGYCKMVLQGLSTRSTVKVSRCRHRRGVDCYKSHDDVFHDAKAGQERPEAVSSKVKRGR